MGSRGGAPSSLPRPGDGDGDGDARRRMGEGPREARREARGAPESVARASSIRPTARRAEESSAHRSAGAHSGCAVSHHTHVWLALSPSVLSRLRSSAVDMGPSRDPPRRRRTTRGAARGIQGRSGRRRGKRRARGPIRARVVRRGVARGCERGRGERGGRGGRERLDRRHRRRRRGGRRGVVPYPWLAGAAAGEHGELSRRAPRPHPLAPHERLPAQKSASELRAEHAKVVRALPRPARVDVEPRFRRRVTVLVVHRDKLPRRRRARVASTPDATPRDSTNTTIRASGFSSWWTAALARSASKGNVEGMFPRNNMSTHEVYFSRK